MPGRYLSKLEVLYAENEYFQPDEVVREIQGQSCDINAGFGGKVVFLHPEWTSLQEEALSDLHFEKSGSPIRNYNDLAMGSGGDHRYIMGFRGGGGTITNAGLFRSDKELSPDDIKSKIGQSGFTNFSRNINQDRNGDYLYLVWA